MSGEVLEGIHPIDTRMGGRAMVTSGYLVEAPEPTLIETGPATSADAVTAGLEEIGLGSADLANIIVTHIHLDHAGGVGTLAQRFPGATIWVHHRGARHLADPSRLMESASRVYGGTDRLLGLFGAMEPVSADRIRPLDEGDVVEIGGRPLEILYTPGHASHHVSVFDGRTGALWTGDALGIHLPDVGVVRPATPPPDIDVEAGVESIERIRQRTESTLLFSHFGPVSEVDELCRLAASRLQKWADVVRDAMDTTSELREIAQILRARTDDEFSSDGQDAESARAGRERYDLLSSMEANAAGLVRYWTKRRDREAQEAAG